MYDALDIAKYFIFSGLKPIVGYRDEAIFHIVEFEFPELESEKKELIEQIVESYGRYDGAALATMTHREDPWLDARKGLSETEGSNALIPKDSIKFFFEKKLAAYVG